MNPGDWFQCMCGCGSIGQCTSIKYQNGYTMVYFDEGFDEGELEFTDTQQLEENTRLLTQAEINRIKAEKL